MDVIGYANTNTKERPHPKFSPKKRQASPLSMDGVMGVLENDGLEGASDEAFLTQQCFEKRSRRVPDTCYADSLIEEP